MDTKLMEYARLVVEVGLNVQKGQTLVVRAPIQCAEFARLCATAGYDVGAREVIVDFTDSELTRMKYLRADDAIFDECPSWQSDKNNTLAKEGAAFLSIYAQDPDMLKGVEPGRIQRAQQSSGKAMEPYYAATMSNQARWCVVSVPVESWAAKVFPDKQGQAAEDALWEAIYSAMHITGDGEAVARWREHTERMEARSKILNDLKLKTLHYTNSLGTDLTIGLPEGAIWAGGAELAQDGVKFVANMPTEEIFTAPHREQVNGKVVSAMPFVLNGNVIGTFTLTFKDGKVVDIQAQNDQDRALLQTSMEVDAGAAYLGEVALVPYRSPISDMGILFYNTLFDENASCHLAYGKAYPVCIEGGAEMDKEALLAHGMNDSITHEDFMVGTADMKIMGTTYDGRTVEIFRDGNFAF